MERSACWTADADQMYNHFAIRHQVFVEEQGVMVFTDVDAWDRHVGTVHTLASVGNHLAGTVRLYEVDDEGTWKGDRLAVLPAYRTSLVGVRLVQYAVATAAASSGKIMHATVQVQNTRFFERLGWTREGPVTSYYGLPHQPMIIDLPGARSKPGKAPERPELHLPVSTTGESPLLVHG